MKLLAKELRLTLHPSSAVFAFLGCLVMVPAYPYSVIFMFGCLAPYITFVNARETNDFFYTAALPVTKRESVGGNASWWHPCSCSSFCFLCLLCFFGGCCRYPITRSESMPLWPGTDLGWFCTASLIWCSLQAFTKVAIKWERHSWWRLCPWYS